MFGGRLAHNYGIYATGVRQTVTKMNKTRLSMLAALLLSAATNAHAQAPPLTAAHREESRGMKVAGSVFAGLGLGVIAYQEVKYASRQNVRYNREPRNNMHLLLGGAMFAVGFSVRIMATPPKPARFPKSRR